MSESSYPTSTNIKVMHNLESIISVDGLRSILLSYFWFSDVIQLSSINQMTRKLLLEEDMIIPYELFNHLLSKTNRFIDHIDILEPSGWNMKTMFAFARRLTKWPTNIALSERMKPNYQCQIDVLDKEKDSDSLPESVRKNQNPCFVYQGASQGFNRTIVSNDHFPVLIQSQFSMNTGLKPISRVPFTKIVHDTETKKSIPVLSYIAYYEISIHGLKKPSIPTHIPRTTTARTEIPHHPCVCIGVARPGFDLYDLMPGWDEHSIAFHGDDGLYFSGQSNHGHMLNDDIHELQFGEKDTVGFGIIYPHTMMKKLDTQGMIPKILQEEQDKKTWDAWKRTAEWARNIVFESRRNPPPRDDENNGEQEHDDDDDNASWSTVSDASTSSSSSDREMNENAQETVTKLNNNHQQDQNTLNSQQEADIPDVRDKETIPSEQMFEPNESPLDDIDEESHGKIIFTKNGKLCATICIQNDDHFFEYPWFPAIGTDCYNIIEVNFGNTGTPFAFDVVAFEQSKEWMLNTKSSHVLLDKKPKQSVEMLMKRYAIPQIRPNECFNHVMQRLHSIWSRFSLSSLASPPITTSSSSSSSSSSAAIVANSLLYVPPHEYYSIYPLMRGDGYLQWKKDLLIKQSKTFLAVMLDDIANNRPSNNMHMNAEEDGTDDVGSTLSEGK